MAKPKTAEQQVRTSVAVIAEHASPENIWEVVESLLELKLGETACFIIIDGTGRMPVVRAANTRDVSHTIGLLSVSIDVVGEATEREGTGEEEEGEEGVG